MSICDISSDASSALQKFSMSKSFTIAALSYSVEVLMIRANKPKVSIGNDK